MDRLNFVQISKVQDKLCDLKDRRNRLCMILITVKVLVLDRTYP